jgi:hypothetical protein
MSFIFKKKIKTLMWLCKAPAKSLDKSSSFHWQSSVEGKRRPWNCSPPVWESLTWKTVEPGDWQWPDTPHASKGQHCEGPFTMKRLSEPVLKDSGVRTWAKAFSGLSSAVSQRQSQGHSGISSRTQHLIWNKAWIQQGQLNLSLLLLLQLSKSTAAEWI